MAGKIIPETIPADGTSQAWDIEQHKNKTQKTDSDASLFTTQTCRHPETGELVTGDESNVSR